MDAASQRLFPIAHHRLIVAASRENADNNDGLSVEHIKYDSGPLERHHPDAVTQIGRGCGRCSASQSPDWRYASRRNGICLLCRMRHIPDNGREIASFFSSLMASIKRSEPITHFRPGHAGSGIVERLLNPGTDRRQPPRVLFFLPQPQPHGLPQYLTRRGVGTGINPRLDGSDHLGGKRDAELFCRGHAFMVVFNPTDCKSDIRRLSQPRASWPASCHQPAKSISRQLPHHWRIKFVETALSGLNRRWLDGTLNFGSAVTKGIRWRLKVFHMVSTSYPSSPC